MKTERTALTWLFVIIAVFVLFLLVYSAASAQSIDQREWLLEHEQVNDMGYPAPGEEPTSVNDMGYPAPGEEPTATAKPKKKQKPTPTISAITKSKCSFELTSDWWTAAWLGQAYVYTDENGDSVYCIGDLPDKYNSALWTPTPTLIPRLTPTPAPTQGGTP